jgi:hypothetical protein
MSKVKGRRPSPGEHVPNEDWIREAVRQARGAESMQVGGDHYRSKAVQPWTAMQAWMTVDEFIGYLRGNVIKYIARYRDKDGLRDLHKARHYLDKLIEAEGDNVGAE